MIPLPKAAKVRLAEGQPVIPDILAASTPARFRGKPRLDAARCPEGCSICVDACPTQAISAPPLEHRSRRLRLLSGLRRGVSGRGDHLHQRLQNGGHFPRRFATGRRPRNLAGSLLARDSAFVRALAQTAFRFRRRLQRLRTGTQRARQREFRHGPLRHRVRRLSPACRRHRHLGHNHARDGARAGSDLRGRAETQTHHLFGACAISGGIFQDSGLLAREFIEKHKIDLYIPGCPPHPLTFLYGLLGYLGKLRPESGEWM